MHLKKRKNPQYSIVTVTYNCAETVERTILSVIEQRDVSFEYIIIDGDSTDDTKKIVRKYLDRISFFVSEPDNGIYDAMNKALSVATGDLVLFINGDDWLVGNDVLSRIYQYYNDDSTILIGRVRYGDKISELGSEKKRKSKYYGVFYPHQATFAPLSLYKELGYFAENYRISADLEWICRAIKAGKKIEWIDVIVSVFSLGGQSSTIEARIDEFNIYCKYMEMDRENEFIPEMIRDITLEVKLRVFHDTITSTDYVPELIELLDGIIDTNKPVQLWGCGYWIEPFFRLFSNCNIKIGCVIDKNADVLGEINEVRAIMYDRTIISQLFVSTLDYDEEISRELISDGFIDGIDFFSFSIFLEMVIRKIRYKSYEIAQFEAGTGRSLI